MLTLYHAGASVCSQKARLALAEKRIAYKSRNLDMTIGEHQTASYLALNPNGVVPTLVTDAGDVIRESSVIIEYVDGLAGPSLCPKAGQALWDTRLWLIRCIEIHAAINALSFATAIRAQILGAMPPDGVEAWLAAVPNPEIREKRRDLLTHGAQSVFVAGAVRIMDGVFRDMSSALADGPWLMGADYTLADCALTAYVDRVRRLGMSGLYEGRFPGVSDWLDATRARDSYADAIQAFYTPAVEAGYLAAGAEAWPEIARKLI
jgi:glutathione S-transferase